jgi:tetratricopeptide (TPR) repeat protein
MASLALDEGQTLADGRYRLTRALGRGGTGHVWAAHDSGSDSEVAVKILDPDVLDISASKSMLRLEHERLRKLVHPGIARVIDYFEFENTALIASQLIAGGDAGRLRGKPWGEILRVLLPATDALEYAHEQGIVHRDIKASNILLDEHQRCYVIDFGVSATLGSGATAGMPGGSLPGMSPQQLAGEAPSRADDVYGFGALLFELLAGQPLFHPDVSEKRIREEAAPRLDQVANQVVPDGLTALVAAMLEKSRERRPASFAAVRAVMEDLLTGEHQASDDPAATEADAGPEEIVPVRRARSRARPVASGRSEEGVSVATGAAGPTRSATPIRPATPTGSAVPGWVMYGGLGLLLVIAAAVIFYLPTTVDDVQPAVTAPDADELLEPDPADTGPDPAESAAQRLIAERALGDLLEVDDSIRTLGIDRWGGEAWLEARAAADGGDESYRNRDYSGAVRQYREALVLMQALEARAPFVFDDALESGLAAIDSGNQPLAVMQLELALAIDRQNESALKAMERAMQLDDVLELVADAANAENSGNWNAALKGYLEASELDPQWGPAVDGIARARGAIAKDRYAVQMSTGFTALAARDYDNARTAFEAAQKTRPSASEPGEAIAQLESEQRLAKIIALEKVAQTFARNEQWVAAVAKYEEILALDDTVVVARNGLAESRSRSELDAQLERELANTHRLNDDAAWTNAMSLVERGRQVQPAGTRLSGQVDRLAAALDVASVPVPVQFQSDNNTQVVVYKVGTLGQFGSRMLSLRPGLYTAVGSRDGFRDVRRQFLVQPGDNGVVELICKEPI